MKGDETAKDARIAVYRSSVVLRQGGWARSRPVDWMATSPPLCWQQMKPSSSSRTRVALSCRPAWVRTASKGPSMNTTTPDKTNTATHQMEGRCPFGGDRVGGAFG